MRPPRCSSRVSVGDRKLKKGRGMKKKKAKGGYSGAAGDEPVALEVFVLFFSLCFELSVHQDLFNSFFHDTFFRCARKKVAIPVAVL